MIFRRHGFFNGLLAGDGWVARNYGHRATLLSPYCQPNSVPEMMAISPIDLLLGAYLDMSSSGFESASRPCDRAAEFDRRAGARLTLNDARWSQTRTIIFLA